MADQFTAVEVTVKFTVLTRSTDHILDGSLVQFGNVLQRGVSEVATDAASKQLAGVIGAVRIETASQAINV